MTKANAQTTSAIETTTVQPIELAYGNVKIAKPTNAPKPNSIAVACSNITAIANKAIVDGSLTALGHKANCKGGVIDSVILSGNVHSLTSFINALSNSGLKVVENDRTKYKPAVFQAVLAKRTVEHVTWCANTSNQNHGGFGSRLVKVGLLAYHAEISAQLVELANQLKNAYDKQYKPLYTVRNKSGLKAA